MKEIKIASSTSLKFLPPFNFPQGRAERLKIARWVILVKEPACREGSFPRGGTL